MQFKHLLSKSLLVAAMLWGGVNYAWAASTTYNFKGFITNALNGNKDLVVGSASGVTLDSQGLNVLSDMNSTNYETRGDRTEAQKSPYYVSIGGKFAASGDFQLNRAGDYGIRTTKNNAFRYFAVLDLNEGDKITFNYESAEQVVFTFYSDNVTGKSVGDNVESGVEYTMSAAGHLDLQSTKNVYARLQSIVITPNEAVESVSNPSAVVASVNTSTGERTLTVTDGVSSTSASVTTYWSASTALTSSNYSSEGTSVVDNTITTTSDVVYLLSVSASPKYSSSVTYNVASAVTLATPSVSLTSFTNNDTWLSAPTFTITEDNSGLVGSPTADLTYTFTPDGGAESAPTTISSGGTYAPTACGILTVYASKTGYVSSSFSIPVSNIYTTEYASDDFSTYDNTSSFSGTWGDATTVTWGGNSVTAYLFTTAGNVETRVHVGANNTVYFIPNWGLTRLGSSYGFRARYGKKGNISTFKYHTSTSDNTAITIGNVLNTSGTGAIGDWTGYCYIPGDNTLMQYKAYVPGSLSVSVEVTSAGLATYVNSDYDLDFSSTSIEAYKVKVSTKGVATLTKVDQVPAGTPVLLYKEGGATEAIPVTTGAAAVSGNDLEPGTGAEVATVDGDYTNMILNNVDGNVGFYFANDKAVATNRAYLHIPTDMAPAASSARPMVINFEGMTGINSVQGEEFMVNGSETYNLQGQRVAQPTKGLYIINGKKVMMK